VEAPYGLLSPRQPRCPWRRWLLGLLQEGVLGGGGHRPGIKIPPPWRVCPGSESRASINPFQHLTCSHDKIVGKLIVVQDIEHQTPLILSPPTLLEY
jgi:hypothetical protein